MTDTITLEGGRSFPFREGLAQMGFRAGDIVRVSNGAGSVETLVVTNTSAVRFHGNRHSRRAALAQYRRQAH